MPTYIFGILEWRKSEIEKIDRKSWKLLAMHGLHHPKGDISRLFIKRRNGGLLTAAPRSIWVIILSKAKTGFVKKHEDGKAKYSLLNEAKAIKNKYLLLSTANSNTSESDAKGHLEKERIEELRDKPMREQFFCLEKPFVDKEASCAWLRS